MFDLGYLIFVVAIPMAISGFATLSVRGTFARYEQVATRRRITGSQAAKLMLERQGVYDCQIEPIKGRLSDHYDPQTRTLRLSEPVFNSTSLSAVGVACHEAGHALQHAQAYPWLTMRSNLVPLTGFASQLSMPIIIGGMILGMASPLGRVAMLIGCGLLAVAFLFSVVTLPVEWDASARAKTAMVEAGIIDRDEVQGAGAVLNAAFLTYLAAAISALITLLYYLMRSGLLRR